MKGGTPEGGLSVVVPSYNEAGNLESLVRRAVIELAHLVDDFEVLIVDDGSRDGTGAIADGLATNLPGVRAFHHPVNVGYGGALRTGFGHAEKEWIAIIPADHQFDVRDLPELFKACPSADIVSSYRLDRKDSLRRCLVSHLYNWFVGRWFGLHHRDLNWVKMFRRCVVKHIDIESRGFSVDVEILLKARCLGYRVAEVPVDHYPRASGQPTAISLKNIYRTLREVVRLRAMIARLQAAQEAATNAVVHPATRV